MCPAMKSTSARRGSAVVVWAMVGGLLLATLFVLGAWLIEPEPLKSRVRHRDLDITELVTPDSLTEDEGRNSQFTPDGSNLVLEQGAWVQVAGDDGTLAQQYSAQRIDPLPDGWMEMQRPRSMMYLDGGRIMTLRGEHGLLNVPNQAIESGTLDGDVVIRLFVPREDGQIDITTDEPEIIIRTDEASFDNALGEIRCDKAIRIDSRDATFAGVGLTVLIGKEGNTIDRLMVERSTAPIRILRRTGNVADDQSMSNDAESPDAEVTPDTAVNSSAPKGPPVKAAKAPPLFYQLTLEENVEVRQYETATSTQPSAILRGDVLVTAFSLDGDAMSTIDPGAVTPSETNDDVVGDESGTLDARAFLGASMIGGGKHGPTPLQDPDSELIEISYDGRLVMLPAPPEALPETVDDLTFSLRGTDRPVEIIDAQSDAVATCARLSYRTDTERIELQGDDINPLVVDSPQMRLQARDFWLVRSRGQAVIEGAGMLSFMEEDASDGDLEITWKEKVDLQFQPGTDQLDSARFRSQVFVENDGFTFTSEVLEVFFEPSEDERPILNRIVAWGDEHQQVRASQLSESGELLADRIEMLLDPDASENPIPRRLFAEGSVRAQDAQQTIWTDDLEVSFSPDESEQGFALDRVNADQGVQVLLENGARAWAERLNGDGLNRRVLLSSDDGDLVLVRGNVISDQLHSVVFDDRTQEARTDGPGRFRLFDTPLTLPVEGRARVPLEFTEAPSLEATWAKMMRFDDLSNDGAGSLELMGDVIVRNVPDDLEENDLDAGFLRLDFMEHEAAPVIDASGNVADPDMQAAFSNSRELAKLSARGNARMESRSWPTSDHTPDPNLFRIQGDDIAYDAMSGDALIEGEGTLLINRLPTPDTGSTTASSPVGLGGDGTSRFSWTDRMTMTHMVANRFKITMTGDVGVLHAGVVPEDTMTMRSDSLDIIVDRPLTSEETSAASTPGSLDLGGQASILRVTSSGRVFVRTPDQDIETDQFDYDVTNGIARLSARKGRLVTLVSRQSPTPVRASEMIWDMRSGRIQITGAQGGAGR